MNAERSARWVRRWVGLYTRGLPDDVRRDRVDEIEDDLWSQLAEAGDRNGVVGTEILGRLVLGVLADLSWRLSARAPAPPQSVPGGSPTTFGRVIAVMAMIGGVAWAVWTIGSVIGGERAWAGSLGYALYWSMLIAAICLPVATFALLAANVDRIRSIAGIIAAIGAAAGLLTIAGAYVFGAIALPLGSAALMLDLARLGAVHVWVARLHAAAGILGTVLVLALVTGFVELAAIGAAAGLSIAFVAYAITWVAIGWSLRDGAWLPEPAANSGPPPPASGG
jgi:hypothetical protein